MTVTIDRDEFTITGEVGRYHRASHDEPASQDVEILCISRPATDRFAAKDARIEIPVEWFSRVFGVAVMEEIRDELIEAADYLDACEDEPETERGER